MRRLWIAIMRWGGGWLILFGGLLLLTRREAAQAPWLFYSAGEEAVPSTTLYRIQPDGSGREVIAVLSGAIYPPVLSPDGQWLALTLFPGMGDSQLAVVDIRHRRTQLIPVPNGNLLGIVWAKDSERLFFTDRAGQVYPYHLRQGVGLPLADNASLQLPLALSPDGQWLLYGCYVGANLEVCKVPTRGGPFQNLTQHPAEDHLGVWSADGQAVYFVSDREGNDNIYRMEAAGGAVKKIVDMEDAVQQFSLANGGKWLLLITQKSGGYHFFRARADGSQVQALSTPPRLAGLPLLSKEDRWLVAAAYPQAAGLADLYVMSVAGEAWEVLTANPSANERYPQWYPTRDLPWQPLLILLLGAGLLIGAGYAKIRA